MHRRIYAVTLLELLIAIILLGLVAIGIFSFDLFGGFHVTTTDRRAQIQNDAAYVLEHMSKEIAKAIGNEKIDGANSVIDTSNIGSYTAIQVYIDANQNGQRDDYWMAYRFRNNGGDKFQMQYCSRCQNRPCNTCQANWEILSRKIFAFTPLKQDNYAEIQVTACSDPASTTWSCGTSDNPQVTMRTRILMPAVSTN